MQNKKILILVLAYNAETTILEVLRRIPALVWAESDILVADDASKDRTAQIAEKYKKENNIKNMMIVHHKINKGYGGNQKWCYNYAIKNGYDIAVMVHGDIQYAPEYIGDLIKPLKEDKADFVFGSRMTGHPIKGGMPIYKYIGNKFLTSVENIILGTNFSEFHSGFRAYSMNALKDIPFNLDADDFHFDSEIIMQLVIAKKRIKEITIPTFYGKEICYVNVITYGLNILKIMLQYLLTKYKIKKYDKFTIK
ncbi:MAG: glycosyltransferase family 2 protein [archaeon]|nr:glycosyltransferase family 2 protein [archaeon]